MQPIDMSNVPHASQVPRGAIVNVSSAEERRRLGWGFVGLLALSAVAGGVTGYLTGRAHGSKRNPKRRRRSRTR